MKGRASARIRILNGKRLRTGAGNSFSRLRVKQVRNRRRILAAKDPDAEPTVDADWMDTLNAACELGVSPNTIRRWARESWKGANSSRALAG